MSKAVLLKLHDDTFATAEKVLRKIHLPRNAYINRAVDFYNRLQLRKLTAKKLKNEATLLKEDTRELLQSFELLEDLES